MSENAKHISVAVAAIVGLAVFLYFHKMMPSFVSTESLTGDTGYPADSYPAASSAGEIPAGDTYGGNSTYLSYNFPSREIPFSVKSCCECQ